MSDPRDKRLDTGMTAGEAMRRGEAWWEATGKHAMRARRMDIEQRVKSRAGGNAPGIVVRSEEPLLGDPILNGLDWDELPQSDRVKVVKGWHHNFVRVPQLKEMFPNNDDPLLKKLMTTPSAHTAGTA